VVGPVSFVLFVGGVRKAGGKVESQLNLFAVQVELEPRKEREDLQGRR